MQLGDFLGLWRFQREILDPSGDLSATAIGQAEITLQADGSARYDERGTLSLPGQSPMTATRRYVWRARPGEIDVRFDDDRPFHTIALGTNSPSAQHWCDPDQYEVAYDFSTWPEWSSHWRVKGPRKDYAMLTRYSRA